MKMMMLAARQARWPLQLRDALWENRRFQTPTPHLEATPWA